MKMYALYSERSLLIYISEHPGDSYLHVQDMMSNYIEEQHDALGGRKLQLMHDWSNYWVPVQDGTRFNNGWYTAPISGAP